jgi:hypothetical protein
VYNFTAQKDNQINQQISAAARKDGAAMKSIALLTMCFLPATFIAVRKLNLNQKKPDTDQSIDIVLHARDRLDHHRWPGTPTRFQVLLGCNHPPHSYHSVHLGCVDGIVEWERRRLRIQLRWS